MGLVHGKAAQKPLEPSALVEHALAGYTPEETAQALGVPAARVRGELRTPSIFRQLSEARAERRGAAAQVLDVAVLEAVRLLREVVNDPMAASRDRIKAATEILDRAGVERGVRLAVEGEHHARPVEALADAELEALARKVLGA